MKKLLSLLTVMAFALPMMAVGTASDPYLNITKYATIDEAGATVDGMESIYKYTQEGGGYWLTLSNYGVMQTDETQNWFESTTDLVDTGSQYTNAWTATDIFQGPSAYFGDNAAYTVKYKQPTKTQTFYVTFCTQVKQYAYHRSNASYYIFKMEIYECEKNADGSITEGTTPIETLQNSLIGTEVLTSQDLDPEKVYKVVIYNSYSYLYEIAFKTPGEFDGEIVPPVAYDATEVEVEHVTMSWSPCQGAKSYTLRTYPAPLRGLIYREKFSNFTAGLTLPNYTDLVDYTDNPGWTGVDIEGADGGILIKNNGSVVTPIEGIRIPGHLRRYTLKFKAKPADGVESGELLVSMGKYKQTFEISGEEKYYTFMIERPFPEYLDNNQAFFTFKNTYWYNENNGGEEEDHRVIMTDFKLYYGDYSEPQNGPSPRYVTPAWDEDTTYVSNIQDITFSFTTDVTGITHFNGYDYWSYDVKSVYFGGFESEWSNRIDYSLSPWPEFLEDDDEPIVEPVPGDVNGDGFVSSVDVTVLYNYLLTGDTEFLVNGDQDGDGSISSVDVTVVYNILLSSE
jgi:hypothetical protein